MIRKTVLATLILSVLLCSGYKRPEKYTITAEKDAFFHNNVGLNYLKDRIYYAAIQEFKIAISLSPTTQASAIFYNNLGETYNFIGYPNMAQDCFENAIKLYGLNFKYYINLVECYNNQGLTNTKIKELSKNSDIYSKIELGLLYIKKGEIRRGINILDELCASEPDLLITPAIRQFITDTIKKNQL